MKYRDHVHVACIGAGTSVAPLQCEGRGGAGCLLRVVTGPQRQAENNILEILDRGGDTTRGPELEGDPQEEKRATLSLPT